MDRFIVAAARHARARLVTADNAILSWRGKVERMDATGDGARDGLGAVIARLAALGSKFVRTWVG